MLTGFQLRAALGIIKIPDTKLSTIIDINRYTLAILKNTPSTEYLRCHTRTLISLENLFKEKDLLFLDDFSVSLKQLNTKSFVSNKLSVFQLRAARASLKLSLTQLAKLTSTSLNSIVILELNDITEYLNTTSAVCNKLINFFVSKSLSFPNNFTIRYNI